MTFEQSSSVDIWSTLCRESVEEIQNQLEGLKRVRPDIPGIQEMSDELDELVDKSVLLRDAIKNAEGQHIISLNPRIEKCLDLFAEFIYEHLQAHLRQTKIPRLVSDTIHATDKSIEPEFDMKRVMFELKRFNELHDQAITYFNSLNLPAIGDSIKELGDKFDRLAAHAAQSDSHLYDIHNALAYIGYVIENLPLQKNIKEAFAKTKREYKQLMKDLNKEGMGILTSVYQCFRTPGGHNNKEISLVKIIEDMISYNSRSKEIILSFGNKINRLQKLLAPVLSRAMEANQMPTQYTLQLQAGAAYISSPDAADPTGTKRKLNADEEKDRANNSSNTTKKRRRGP